MRTSQLVRRGAWVLILLAALPAAAAPPQPINIPDSALQGAIAPAYLDQIRQYAEYWAKQIADASDEQGILAARTKLLDGYGQYNSPTYRYEYARLSSDALAAPLNASGPLAAVRQVNGAIATARMPQVANQALLEKMANHANPGVRFWAWQGYRAMRPVLLPQQKSAVEKMYALLDSRMAKESSAPVVGVMLATLNLAPIDMESAGKDVREFAPKQGLTILSKHWRALCLKVQAGDGLVAEACRDGVMTLQYLYAVGAGGNEGRTAQLQALVDVAWAASRAYDRARAAAKDAADPKAKAEAEARVEPFGSLLRDVEVALNSLTGKNDRPVLNGLTDTRVADRGAAVQLGVLNWVDLLKSSGVIQPTLPEPPRPTTAATAPSPAK